jgi:DNA (cytosine-5)-methyltransferase 1
VNELALFAGIGGGLLASKWRNGWRTVCYVEHDPYCVQVIQARIKDGYLDDAPIWDDVRTFDGRPWRGSVDIITAGFPCQPFSAAGRHGEHEDDRNMWPGTIRCIREVQPRSILLENVSRLVSTEYFGTVIGDLAESGYDARWDCIPAAAIGACHVRERVWILAHAHGQRVARHALQPDIRSQALDLQAIKPELAEWIIQSPTERSIYRYDRAFPSFDIFGMDDDDAYRVERIRAIGNAQVPGVAASAWRLLS